LCDSKREINTMMELDRGMEFGMSQNFYEKLLWEEEGATSSKAEGGGAILESMEGAGGIFSESVRSIFVMRHLWDEWGYF